MKTPRTALPLSFLYYIRLSKISGSKRDGNDISCEIKCFSLNAVKYT